MKAALIKSAVLSSAALLLTAPFAFATSALNLTAVTSGVDYLRTQQAADGHIGASGSDTAWSAVALAASGAGLDSIHTAGGTNLRAYLAANPPAAAASATDYERAIIAITADQQNPYNFGGVNYVAKLQGFVSGNQLGSVSDTNDDFFGLMALVAARVDVADSVVTDEIAEIVSFQHADGGFSYSTDPANGSDVDDTAAAIMALRAAQSAGASSPALSTALASAQTYMLGMQNATDHGFPFDANFGAISNVSSTAWVVIALNALGLGNGTAATDAQAFIRSQQLADGSFPSSFAPSTGDIFDTAPAVTALTGGTYPLHTYSGSLTDVAPSPSPSPTPTPSASPTPTPTPVAGQVLGASTDPVATGSVLPAVGELSNQLLLGAALAIAILAGLGVYLRQRRRA